MVRAKTGNERHTKSVDVQKSEVRERKINCMRFQRFDLFEVEWNVDGKMWRFTAQLKLKPERARDIKMPKRRKELCGR